MRPLLVTTVLFGLAQSSQVYSQPSETNAMFTCHAPARSWCEFRVYYRPPNPGQWTFVMHSGTTRLIPRLRLNHDVYCACIGMRVPNDTCHISSSCKGPVPVQANNDSPRHQASRTMQ
jgi:hypothetical protein